MLLIRGTYVATGEVTALKHKLRDDAVESGASVSVALLASAESTEVLNGLWDIFLVESEVDTAGLLCRSISVSFEKVGRKMRLVG